jgi:iron complex transport system substrate-binding protein
MGRNNSEVGESPALSRNCNPILESQGDILKSVPNLEVRSLESNTSYDYHSLPFEEDYFFWRNYGMLKKRSLIVLLVVLVFILSACSTFGSVNVNKEQGEQVEDVTGSDETANNDSSIKVVDGLGKTIVLESAAMKVVSLAPSNTEILYAIGAGEQVVARDDFSNYPTEALELPAVGGSWGNLNTEAIIALEPDLILANMLYSVETLESLEALGLVVYTVPNPADFDDLFTNMFDVARLVGKTEETTQVIEGLQARVDAVVEIVADAETSPVVFYELDATDPNAPYSSGSDTYVDNIITMAGGTNMAAAVGSSWVQISVEEIIAQDPDMILLGDSMFGITIESVVERPGWDALTAIQNGQIFPFNDDLVSRSGPRMVEGLEEMAKVFFPELFE